MYPDPDSAPDPAILVLDFQGANKNLKSFSAYYFFEGTFT
jgi:hypothetical protein